jgi:quercetin dioxygenase-like cupin family protein
MSFSVLDLAQHGDRTSDATGKFLAREFTGSALDTKPFAKRLHPALFSLQKIVTLFVTPECDLTRSLQLFNVGMKRTSLQPQPYMLATHNKETRFEVLGALVRIQAGTEQTGDAFNLFDVLIPSGYETPLHIHYGEDVAIQIIQGTLDIFWGTEKKQAEAGSFFFQPRGTPHGFRVTGTMPARISYLTIPAGFDGFVLELSRPVPDFERVLLEARYKIEVLGPLPG